MTRIVVYMTCWNSGCNDVDILAAFDDAIRDGVHVLSLSLGPDFPQGDCFTNVISVGSFHAASYRITVVALVGNKGIWGSATNLALWIITVTANSTGRDFVSDIRLGNGNKIVGESLSLLQMNTSKMIISASDAYVGYFTPYQSREPMSRIFSAKTVLRSQSAPRVTAFSSKGRNALTPDILKPDIIAPGLNILAAWFPASKNMLSNILSGTSMDCQHLIGITALIKLCIYHVPYSSTNMFKPKIVVSSPIIAFFLIKRRPNLQNAANLLDKNGKPITVDSKGRKGNAFDYGAGFVNPTRVLDPGLIYDAQREDYKAFLCSIGYNDKLLQLITGDNKTCDQTFATPTSLNYPSIAVPHLKDKFSVTRTVTNVGDPRSIYVAVMSPPMGINITVAPKLLVISRYGENMTFTMNFKVEAPLEGYKFGFLTWRSRTTWVTTPLVVRVALFDYGLLR
ncbi:Subtilisin-like protease SBT3.15 [Camellia lanceoleosa]|uniref:Subtilisin-like protease SBT3.15 n=1 Tax=Camellia lanceoleosa TaxID=1840588 RepID=A0ACC0I313_9ERIC|nr:Subtilisin-like protease SBT3.15 [Camellia lanceoleosa]